MSPKSRFEADIVDFNTELICTYITLDELIEKCNFNEKQKLILEFYQEGLTEKDIANELDDVQQNINSMINTCITKIAKQNQEDWLKNFIYWDKKKINENWKQCSKCEKWKPESEFYRDERSKNGFRSECKKCK